MSESPPFLPTTAELKALPEASDALPVGARLAEFEIREVIGVGGFGIVYRAWDSALEREVEPLLDDVSAEHAFDALAARHNLAVSVAFTWQMDAAARLLGESQQPAGISLRGRRISLLQIQFRPR